MFRNLLIAMDLSSASICLLRCVGPLRGVGAESATLLHVMDVHKVGGLYISLKNLVEPFLKKRRSNWEQWVSGHAWKSPSEPPFEDQPGCQGDGRFPHRGRNAWRVPREGVPPWERGSSPPANGGEAGPADSDHDPGRRRRREDVRRALRGLLPPPPVRHRFLRTRRAGFPLLGAHCGSRPPAGGDPLPCAGPGTNPPSPRPSSGRIQPDRLGEVGRTRKAARGVGEKHCAQGGGVRPARPSDRGKDPKGSGTAWSSSAARGGGTWRKHSSGGQRTTWSIDPRSRSSWSRDIREVDCPPRLPATRTSGTGSALLSSKVSSSPHTGSRDPLASWKVS